MPPPSGPWPEAIHDRIRESIQHWNMTLYWWAQREGVRGNMRGYRYVSLARLAGKGSSRRNSNRRGKKGLNWIGVYPYSQQAGPKIPSPLNVRAKVGISCLLVHGARKKISKIITQQRLRDKIYSSRLSTKGWWQVKASVSLAIVVVVSLDVVCRIHE